MACADRKQGSGSSHSSTPLQKLVLGVLCCLQCLIRLEHEGWDFLFHGVFCFLVFSNLTYTGYMHFYGEQPRGVLGAVGS